MDKSVDLWLKEHATSGQRVKGGANRGQAPQGCPVSCSRSHFFDLGSWFPAVSASGRGWWGNKGPAGSPQGWIPAATTRTLPEALKPEWEHVSRSALWSLLSRRLDQVVPPAISTHAVLCCAAECGGLQLRGLSQAQPGPELWDAWLDCAPAVCRGLSWGCGDTDQPLL